MERAQGSFLSRWLRTTFDYNPTFPLTALALLAGLRMLAGESSVSDAASGILGASGVLQAYELLLLGVALSSLERLYLARVAAEDLVTRLLRDEQLAQRSH